MHKIEVLEKKWYRYKLKLIMIPFVGSVITAFIGSGGYYLYYKNIYPHHRNQTKVLAETKEANLSNTKVVMEEPLLNVAKELERKKSNNILLEPVVPVVDMAKEEAISYTKKRVIKKHKTNKRLVKAKVNNYLTAKELASMRRAEHTHTSKPHVMKRMKFHSTSANYIEIMKEKYEHSHSSRDALLLAKAFYKKSFYKEAELWALKANKIDSKLDESWLLFAKSKAKMGKKQEAINILAKYYTKSKSARAKALIGQIKTGRI